MTFGKDLSDLKVGDKVFYCRSHAGSETSKTITTVVKITKTGRIRIALAPDAQFRPNGDLIGGDIYSMCYLKPYDEIEAKRMSMKKYISNTNIKLQQAFDDNKVTLEMAKKFNEILENGV